MHLVAMIRIRYYLLNVSTGQNNYLWVNCNTDFKLSQCICITMNGKRLKVAYRVLKSKFKHDGFFFLLIRGIEMFEKDKTIFTKQVPCLFVYKISTIVW